MIPPNAIPPIALLTSDWHMMPHAWAKRKTLAGDADCVLQQVAATALARQLPIIAAGDLFDSRYPPILTMVRTMRLIRYLDGYYIMGNHDRTVTPWMWLVGPDWVDLGLGPVDLPPSSRPAPEVRPGKEVLPPLFDTEKQWRLHGVDYCLFPSQLQAELDRLQEGIDPNSELANLLVLHQQSETQIAVGDCELADRMIPDPFDLVILGHHHQPEVFTILNKSGRPLPCLSPGGFHLKKINEEPVKQLYTLYADGSIHAEPLVTRRVITVDLNGKSQQEIVEKVEKILATIKNTKGRRPAEIEQPIVSVQMDGKTFPGAEQLLEEMLGESVHLFIKKEDEETDEINVSPFGDIDVERYTEIGVRYAREIFPNCEPDRDVREIVETMLTMEASDGNIDENYAAMKAAFLHRRNAACLAGCA